MTRRHYIALADSLGLELRNTDSGSETTGIWLAIYAICEPLKQENSRFDKTRFIDHIDEIASGDRKVTT